MPNHLLRDLVDGNFVALLAITTLSVSEMPLSLSALPRNYGSVAART